MSKETWNFTYRRVQEPKELDEPDRELVAAATEAMNAAYAPYSSFRVGAAVRLADGTLVPGSNQENMAYPSGLCAERVALFSAASLHPGVEIEALAVVADAMVGEGEGTISPCGGCRQVMIEYERKQEPSIRIISGAARGPLFVTDTAESLLPLAFFDPELAKRRR